MTRLFLISVLLLAFVAGGGCASSRVPDERPRTLDQVNRQLDGRWARILRTDGRLIEDVEHVVVRADSTTLSHRLKQKKMTIATRSVHHVQVRGATGGGSGFLKGAAPGIVSMFMGGGLLLVGSLDERSGASVAPIFGSLLVGGGLVVGIIGGASGALIGDAASEDEWITIYEGPVQNYRR